MGRTRPEGAGNLRTAIFAIHEEEVDALPFLTTRRGVRSPLPPCGPSANEIRGEKKGARIQDAGPFYLRITSRQRRVS